MENQTVAVCLRSPLPEDTASLLRIRFDHDLQNELMAYPPMPYIDDVNAWLLKRQNNPDELFKIVADARHNNCVGFVQITNIHHRSKHGYLGIAIDPIIQGKGYGSAAIVALMEFAKNSGAFHKLLLEVRTDNIRAIGLYKAKGFREIGVMSEHYFQDAMWHHALLMEFIL